MIPFDELAPATQKRITDFTEHAKKGDHATLVKAAADEHGKSSITQFANWCEMSYEEIVYFSALAADDRKVLIEATERHWGKGYDGLQNLDSGSG